MQPSLVLKRCKGVRHVRGRSPPALPSCGWLRAQTPSRRTASGGVTPCTVARPPARAPLARCLVCRPRQLPCHPSHPCRGAEVRTDACSGLVL